MKEQLQLILEDLKNIIDKSASGDVRAQEKLYHMLAPKMFGVCLRYAKDKADAEDNLQEGFIKVFTNIGKFRHEGSFEGWVRRIFVNLSLEKYRKQYVIQPVEDVGIYETYTYSNDIIDQISATELVNIIQELPPRYRMVFNLYVMEGMNHQEISEKMDISVGTSKSNLARGREILKRKVKELYSEKEKNANHSA